MCISKTTCWLVLLQLQLEVKTQQVGQMGGHFWLHEAYYCMWKVFWGRLSSLEITQSWVLLLYLGHQCGKRKWDFLAYTATYTSRKLQLLDCTVLGLYTPYYNTCINDWMLSNPGKHVTIYSVTGIIGKSFNKPFTKHNIEKGLNVTGIYPLHKNIFGEDEFLSSYVTDRTYN